MEDVIARADEMLAEARRFICLLAWENAGAAALPLPGEPMPVAPPA